MSKHDKIAKLKEYIRNLIVKELEEVSTTASAGAANPMGTGIYYDTPMAFSGGRKKDKKKKKKISTAAGMKPVKEVQLPGVVKVKLQKTIDSLSGKKLNKQQKISVLKQIIKSLGIDKGDVSTLSQRVKSTMESTTNESFVPSGKVSDVFLKLKSKGFGNKKFGNISKELSKHYKTPGLADVMASMFKEMTKGKMSKKEAEKEVLNWVKTVAKKRKLESVNESKEPEVITQLRDIVKRKSSKKIKDPKTKKNVRVDMFSANVITQVYDAIKKNSSHRNKFESLPLDKMAQLSFKMMKR